MNGVNPNVYRFQFKDKRVFLNEVACCTDYGNTNYCKFCKHQYNCPLNK